VENNNKIICLSLQGQDVAFEPAKLLWLIQRDFLRKLLPVLLITIFCLDGAIFILACVECIQIDNKVWIRSSELRF